MKKSWSPELKKALNYIRSLHEDLKTPKSLAALEKMLRGNYNKATIGRWLAHTENSPIRATAAANIIEAASILREHCEFPDEIKFGVILHATEMLPVHLLEKHLEWQSDYGAVVKLDKSAKDIPEVLAKLADAKVDFAIAPHFSDISELPKVKRFFQIAEIEVEGLFPLATEYDDLPQVKKVVAILSRNRQAIGLLKNADYQQSLAKLMGANTAPPPPILVANHDEALDLLKVGQIHAVIGHSVFIANTIKAIACYRSKATETEWIQLAKLRRIPGKVMNDVAMDIFVNISNKRTKIIARKSLGLLSESLDYLVHNRSDPSLDRDINDVLGLNSEDQISGKAVLNSCKYCIKMFDTETLLELW